MASKTKKSSKKPLKKTVTHKKPIKRYVPIPGDSARRYRDKRTGKVLSRRAAEKLQPRVKKTPVQRRDFNRKVQKYLHLRDDFIRHERRLGRRITKSDAAKNETFKLILKALRVKPSRKMTAKDVARVKAQALYRLGRVSREEIVQYVEKFFQDVS